MFGLRIFKYLLKIPTLIFCVAFVVLNMQDTTLYYSPLATPITLPLWLLGITLFSLGFIVGALLVWLNTLPARKELKQARTALKKAEGERDTLENNIRERGMEAVAALDDHRDAI